MSVDALAFAKALDLGELEGAQARLLVYVIAENTFNDTFVCRLCQEQMAYEAGRVSERTIRRHLDALEEGGVILRLRQHDDAGHAKPDIIRIVGYKRWYYRDHAAARRRSASERQPDKLSARAKRTNCPVGDDPNRTNSTGPTGQQVSGAYKDIPYLDSRTSPPDAPKSSTSGTQAGGGKVNPSGSKSAGGWAKGWTDAAKVAVDDIRWSNNDAVAGVAEAFFDKVRGTLAPPPRVDAVAYVTQLGAKLRFFDKATLAALAEHQIGTRSRDLDSIANLEAAARGGCKPAAAAGTSAQPVQGVEISLKSNPAAVKAWIDYANGPAGKGSREIRFIGQSLERWGHWVVPTTLPPVPTAGAAP